MAQSQFLRNIKIVADRQDAPGRPDTFIGDEHGTVVERGVLEKNIFNQALVEIGINLVARFCHLTQRRLTFDNNQRPLLTLTHTHTGQHHRHNSLLVGLVVLIAVGGEEFQQTGCMLVGTYIVEKLADVLLKEYDESNDSYTHEFVHDGTEQPHLENLGNKEPHHHKHHDAHEDVERPRLLHQFIDIVEDDSHQQDVNHVFQSKIKKHRLFR